MFKGSGSAHSLLEDSPQGGAGFKDDPQWFFTWNYDGLRHNQGQVTGRSGPESNRRNYGVCVHIEHWKMRVGDCEGVTPSRPGA